MRPMRRKDREVTNKTVIESILKIADYGMLGLSDEGIPYVIPLNYVWHNNSIFFHCANEGRKLEIISQNPCCSFCVVTDGEVVEGSTPCNWGFSYKSVMIFGKISVIKDQQEKSDAMIALMKHFAGPDFNHEFSKEELNSVTVLKLNVEEMSCKVRPAKKA